MDRGRPSFPGPAHSRSRRLFKLIPHADGIGAWRACEIVQEVEPNGVLKVFDWTNQFRIRFDAAHLKQVLNVESDLELLSHIFDGCCFKACPPREIRLAPNARSLASRAKPIAADLGNLAAKGHYALRPLCRLDTASSLDPAADLLPTFPLGFLPTWSSTSSATDKPGKPSEKRRLADGSGPTPTNALETETRESLTATSPPTSTRCAGPCGRRPTTRYAQRRTS